MCLYLWNTGLETRFSLPTLPPKTIPNSASAQLVGKIPLYALLLDKPKQSTAKLLLNLDSLVKSSQGGAIYNQLID